MAQMILVVPGSQARAIADRADDPLDLTVQ